MPVDPHSLPITSDLAKTLRGHVEYLAGPKLQGRKPGTAGNREAAAYLETQFHAAGLQPLASLGGYRQPLAEDLGDNLLGMRPASESGPTDGWLIVGAHYDHLGGSYLGADDNASAAAILIETARSLPPLQHHHILFAAFNAEEPPYIRTPQMGSQYFTDHLPSEIGSLANVQAVVIMDLMGGVHWEPLKETIFAAGAEKSPGLYRRLKEAASREAKPLTPDASPLTILPVGLHLIEQIPFIGQVAFSDYDAFRNRAVPFLLLSSGRTPRYHQPTDLPDTLHYERMAVTVEWLQHLLRAVEEDREPYRFEADRVEFADDVASVRPLVARAATEETTIPGTSFLSLWKLRRDRQWLEGLDPTAPTPNDVTRLERVSIRLQCLLADFTGCFLM
ncbi:MAG: M28 family peptidase [Nitrospirae bacterium]|nr:MAG: M28 family peptidase [Nitrospirota bacterium]